MGCKDYANMVRLANSSQTLAETFANRVQSRLRVAFNNQDYSLRAEQGELDTGNGFLGIDYEIKTGATGRIAPVSGKAIAVLQFKLVPDIMPTLDVVPQTKEGELVKIMNEETVAINRINGSSQQLRFKISFKTPKTV